MIRLKLGLNLKMTMQNVSNAFCLECLSSRPGAVPRVVKPRRTRLFVLTGVHFGVGHFGVSHFGVGHFGAGHFGAGHFGAGHFGVGHFGAGIYNG